MPEEKNRAAKHIWLQYFNQYLFEQGTITEKERNQMHIKIEQKWKQTV